jgi:outer membrane protein assembly factor BamD (BamD/ComL family)
MKLLPLTSMLLLSGTLAFAESDALRSSPPYQTALQAVAHGVPAVAVVKLEELLRSELNAEDREQVTLTFARALLDAGDFDKVLLSLDKLAAPAGSEAAFLRASALVGLQRWTEAWSLFRQITAETDSPLFVSATLGVAECLRAMGKPGEAIALLESTESDKRFGNAAKLLLADIFLQQREGAKCETLLKEIKAVGSAEERTVEYLQAQSALFQRRFETALTAFEKVISQPRGVPESVFAGATLGVAEARARLKGPESADDVIEEFIRQHPTSRFLSSMFRKLDEFYAREENPQQTELRKWAESPPQSRAAMAVYYLAQVHARAKNWDETLATLNGFGDKFPGDPLFAEAALLRGAILVADGRAAEATQEFEAAMRAAKDKKTLARVEFAAAEAHFKRGEFVLAATYFRNAAQHSAHLRENAIFNAALAWLNQGSYEQFSEAYNELVRLSPGSSDRKRLMLEEGLSQARTRNARAEATLGRFLTEWPDHPRSAEARIALAEIAFLRKPADLTAAHEYLRAANETAPANPETTERGEYLAIFVADAAKDRSDDLVIAACQAFIKKWPGSAFLSDVRMKLGEIYFRRQDFAGAQTQFELIARESPGSPYAESATFLAGRAAMNSMNTENQDQALKLFEEVARFNASLKPYARQEQAVLKSRLGDEEEAIILYDDILNGRPEGAVLFPALCGKGDSLFRLGNKDAKYFEQGATVYADLAQRADGALTWRNQALYKKGKCYEKLGRSADALAAFYDVLDATPGENVEPEYFWYYKSGFDAARLLESEAEWKPAIAIYEKMSLRPGPRADEAKNRANQLRLEHFIWAD